MVDEHPRLSIKLTKRDHEKKCLFLCQVKSKSMPHHQNWSGINKDKSPAGGPEPMTLK